MTSRKTTFFIIFMLTLAAYVLFYLIGMINETRLSRILGVAGLAPIIIYFLARFILYLHIEAYRSYHFPLAIYFITLYMSAGILLFGSSMNVPLPDKAFFVGLQAALLLIAYGLGVAKFNPTSSARELRKSARQQNEQIHIVGPGVALQGSYDRVPKYRWLNRLYATGKALFYLAILPLALLGGGAGLVMVRLLEGADLGIIGVSSHSMVMYFVSLFFAILAGFAIPAVRFNFQWWRELDAKVRQEYGHVEYVWEKDKG